jgi:hypothetical protein
LATTGITDGWIGKKAGVVRGHLGDECGHDCDRRVRHPLGHSAVTPYEAFGGEAFVRSLCARFYVLMDMLPEAAACRAVHPPSLVRAEEKLFEYLCQRRYKMGPATGLKVGQSIQTKSLSLRLGLIGVGEAAVA